MSQLQANLQDDLQEALNEVASRLDKTPEETMELALHFFLQMESVDHAIIGKERFNDKSELVSITIDDDEDALEYKLKFHTDAMAEYEALAEEQQMLMVCALVTRLFDDEEAELVADHFPEMLLHSTEETELVLTHFPFGDIVYAVNEEAVEIYFIHLLEEALDEDEDDFEDDDFDAEFEEVTEAFAKEN